MLQFNYAKFKQELPSIVFVSGTQLFLAFSFPGYNALGGCLRYAVSLISSIATMYVCVLGFSCADKFKFYINFDGFDDLPYADIYAEEAKALTKISLSLVVVATMYVLWRVDYYCMHNMGYFFLYGHMITSFALFHRAAHR